MKQIALRLKSPLFTEWSVQHVKLTLKDVASGAPLRLTVNGTPTL